MKDVVQISVRIDREVLKEYKKWLIEQNYRSINQHINEMIRETLKKAGKLPPENGQNKTPA